ncbi:LacI family DNA-binding transcriptional regulator [Paenibacillus sp. HJGM_3]|uniref:LacI family DNA-binding transcriptional regulator n=1 Tax=Paenibacillus sp. HJGM_3 TaxID=3379816 RepID=UPI00385B7576
MERKYTIRDIAELSGFSFKTVSRVINNEPNVKPETRDKILKVISNTNFKPNLFAKNLSTKTMKNVLISIRKTYGQNTTQWFDILMSYMNQAARSRHYSLIQEIIYDDGDLINSMMEQSSGYIDAVILFYLQENDKRIELAQNNRIPLISFERNKQVPVSISNNNKKGILEATQFLFGRGLTRICLLLGARIGVNLEREEAIRDVYLRSGISLDQLEIVHDMNNLERIKQFVDGKIAGGDVPQVFFVSGDEKAIAVYHSVYANGLSIPNDVSIIGFDNIPISRYYYPPLTTMAQDFETLANKMFEVIDKLLLQAEDVCSIEVEPQLVIRKSVK